MAKGANSESMVSRRDSQCILKRNPALHPSPDGLIADSEVLAGIENAPREIPHDNHFCSSGVSHLFGARGPAAVVRLVVAVVVDSLKRESRRLLAHVAKKVYELLPSFADLNAAITVVLELLVVRIRTPLQHCAPRRKCSRRSGAGTLSMNCGAFFYLLCGYLPMKASARASISGSKVHVVSFHRGSALAHADASRKNLSSWRAKWRSLCDYDEPCEAATDEGYSGRHMFGFIKCLFSGGRRPQPALTANSLTDSTGGVNA